jgi:hypothetical protein
MQAEELKNYIISIQENVNSLSVDERKHLLNFITKNGTSLENVADKGTGCEIRFSKINPSIIPEIDKYIKDKINDKVENLLKYTTENLIPQ